MNKTVSKPITKTVKKKEELFIEFTPEEMEELGLEPHDKFEVEVSNDQTIVLKKFAKIDLDLSEFDKTTLEMLVSQSIELQIPVDEVISQILTEKLKQYKEDLH